MFSAVLNIILDFVLIQGFKIGVAGAAVATDISQLVSGVACLIYMNKRFEVLKLSAKDRRAGKRYMINLCMNGIPMGLQLFDYGNRQCYFADRRQYARCNVCSGDDRRQ